MWAAGGMHRWSGRVSGGSAYAIQRVHLPSTYENPQRSKLCQ